MFLATGALIWKLISLLMVVMMIIASSAQEAAKEHMRNGYWKCNICGKAFTEERYIDMHMDNRHKDMLPVTSGDADGGLMCMESMCDVLLCDAFEVRTACIVTPRARVSNRRERAPWTTN